MAAFDRRANILVWDAAGSARDYNRRWAASEDLDLHWIPGAGHNSNTDAPAEVNALIEEFWERLG